MKIHHLRNATFIIEAGENFILIDPMLGEKETLPPFSIVRHKPRRNPTVALPKNSEDILNKVTFCLITHSHTFGLKALQHTDHLDEAGEAFLKKNTIPVGCRTGDVVYLKKTGLTVQVELDYWDSTPVLNGKITAIPAKHGHGWVHKMMANGAGFFIQLPDEPSIYICGDTVFTADVERVLNELSPDISVVASGSARLDVGGPILMPLEEIIAFVSKAPNKVIANHLEALNHCSTTREQLKNELEKNNLLSKTMIPADGETFSIDLKSL